jgi:DNA-binding MurR/RpiR family transcriptional regulator
MRKEQADWNSQVFDKDNKNRVEYGMLIWDAIETQHHLFSATDLKLIEYLRQTPNIVFKSITEVIEESGVSYGSVIRFTKKLGCSGFQDFKIRLAGENHQLEPLTDEEVLGTSWTENFLRSARQQLLVTARNCDNKVLSEIVQRIINARQILVVGVGGSYPVAQELTYRLLRMGFANTSIESDEHAQGYRISMLGPKDLLIVFSYSGSTKSILDTARLAKHAHVHVAVFTNYVKSPLMELADSALITSIREPALQAELGTKLPFYFLLELLCESLYEASEPAREALEHTSEAVSDKLL